jgi:hypothetical protein
MLIIAARTCGAVRGGTCRGLYLAVRHSSTPAAQAADVREVAKRELIETGESKKVVMLCQSTLTRHFSELSALGSIDG